MWRSALRTARARGPSDGSDRRGEDERARRLPVCGVCRAAALAIDYGDEQDFAGIAAIHSRISSTPWTSITRLGSSGILMSGSSEFIR